MIAVRGIKRLDVNFDDAVKSIKFKYAKSDLTTQKREERRALADTDDFEFCKIYFPQIFNDDWNELHRKIKDAESGINTISGSRYFGKSAFTYISKIVKPLCIGGGGMIGLGLRNQDVAALRTKSIMRLIKKNEMLRHDYNVQIQQDLTGNYLVNNKSFVSFGFREGLRNYFDENFQRFDVMILDDLYNAQTISSDVDNEKILTFVESECTGQLNPDGVLIWLFNYISTQSPGYKYAERHPEKHFNLPALNEKGETNWPESRIWTTERLREKEKELTFDVWMGDWMNNPLVKGEEFDPDWIRSVNVNYQSILATLSFADPSFGTSPQACFKSLITMSYTSKKQYIIQDVYLRKESYEKFFAYAYNVSISFPKWKTLLFENDFSQWSMAQPYYKQWRDESKRHLSIQMFNTKDLKDGKHGTDKESRIRTLIFPFQVGELIFNQDVLLTKDYEKWFAQFLGFGKSKEKLDGLDATASGYILFPRYIVSGSFKALNTKLTKKESWLENR